MKKEKKKNTHWIEQNGVKAFYVIGSERASDRRREEEFPPFGLIQNLEIFEAYSNQKELYLDGRKLSNCLCKKRRQFEGKRERDGTVKLN